MKNAILAAAVMTAVATIGWCIGAGHMDVQCRDILVTSWIIIVFGLQA